jgi:hypothetical protein
MIQTRIVGHAFQIPGPFGIMAISVFADGRALFVVSREWINIGELSDLVPRRSRCQFVRQSTRMAERAGGADIGGPGAGRRRAGDVLAGIRECQR